MGQYGIIGRETGNRSLKMIRTRKPKFGVPGSIIINELRRPAMNSLREDARFNKFVKENRLSIKGSQLWAYHNDIMVIDEYGR